MKKTDGAETGSAKVFPLITASGADRHSGETKRHRQPGNIQAVSACCNGLPVSESVQRIMCTLAKKYRQVHEAYEQLLSIQSETSPNEIMSSVGRIASDITILLNDISHETTLPMSYLFSNRETFGQYTVRVRDYLRKINEVLVQLNTSIGVVRSCSVKHSKARIERP